jgi:nitrogen-specific signal transduction histidine kinase
VNNITVNRISYNGGPNGVQARPTSAQLAAEHQQHVAEVAVQREHEQARARGEKDRAEKSQKLAEDRAEEIRRGLEGLKSANALLEQGRSYSRDQRWDDAYAHFTRAT